MGLIPYRHQPTLNELSMTDEKSSTGAVGDASSVRAQSTRPPSPLASSREAPDQPSRHVAMSCTERLSPRQRSIDDDLRGIAEDTESSRDALRGSKRKSSMDLDELLSDPPSPKRDKMIEDLEAMARGGSSADEKGERDVEDQDTRIREHPGKRPTKRRKFATRYRGLTDDTDAESSNKKDDRELPENGAEPSGNSETNTRDTS